MNGFVAMVVFYIWVACFSSCYFWAKKTDRSQSPIQRRGIAIGYGVTWPVHLFNGISNKRKVAESKQPKEKDFNTVVGAMKHDYEAGLFQKVYEVRERYGFIGETESGIDRPTWFWFNAYGALGGLKSGHILAGTLATACGYASSSVDWANADENEMAANAEIEKLAFG